MKFAAAAFCLLIAGTGGAQPLSGELAHLESLKGDEEKLVETVRRVDLQQKALVAWDGNLAEQYSDQGLQDLAETKRQDTRRRLALVKDAWQYVLSHYPNNARANNYYGELLYDYLGDPVGGLQYWQVAVRVDKELSQAHNNLGIHYFHHGDYERGLIHLGKALDLEPKNPDYLFNVSQIYLNYFPQILENFKMSKEKLFKEAMRMSREAAQYAPDDFEIVQDYATNFYAAENFGVKVNWQEAAQAWQKAHAVARNEQDKFFTLLNEGRTWISANQLQNAATALNKALEYEPDSRVARQLLEKTAVTPPS